MSIDKSLRSLKVLVRHRSVLTRAERIERLEAEERWSEDEGVLGLAKVRNLRVKRVRPKQEKPDAEAVAAEAGAEVAEGAPAAESETSTD